MSGSLPSEVAVTGASGVVGRRLVTALLARGVRVRALSRSPTPPGGQPAFQIVSGDVRDASALARLLCGAESVIHLAAVAHTSLRRPGDVADATAINVGGTRALLRAARAAGVSRFIYLSSAHVYAGQQGIDLREDDAKDAGAGYASMKLQAEELLQREWPENQTLTILRPCLAYGPGVRFNLQQLMAALQTGRYVHPGGADALRSFVSVDTVSAAVLHLLRHDRGGIYNVADQDPLSLREWVNLLAWELRARPPRTVPVGFLRFLAGVGTLAQGAGLLAPLTIESLRKLTVPFTLNLERLGATGFEWPPTTGPMVQEMVAEFKAPKPKAACQ